MRAERPEPVPGFRGDLAFLAAAVSLSCALYVGQLGFYSDDWYYLARFSQASNPTFSGLLESIAELRGRPLHNSYQAVLYRMFGTDPLGYHAVNSVVLVLSSLFFYWALRELGMVRPIAVSVPLLYALLPHYSTARFWVAANAPNLSMALYFVSLAAGLRAVRSSKRSALRWMILAIGALVASALTYEVVFPLFVGSIFLISWRAGLWKRPPATVAARRRIVGFLVASVVALAAVVVFKFLSIQRPYVETDYLARGRYVLWSVLSISFFGPNGYGLGLPRTVWRVLRDHPDLPRLIVSGFFGVGAFLYLRRLFRRDSERIGLDAAFGVRMAIAGFAFFLLGYAMAFVTPEVTFSKTGVNNRTAISAAAGLSVFLVGVCVWIGAVIRSRSWRRIGAPLCVSLLATAAFLVVHTISSFWEEAHDRQATIILGLRQILPRLPPGSVVLIDGACPYIGPGIVFECHWDVGGALQLAYADTGVRGDVVTRRMTVEEKGLASYVYRMPDPAEKRAAASTGLSHCCQHYTYGPNLFVYNALSRDLLVLRDLTAARRYFERGPDNRSCPGAEGVGAPAL